MPSLSNEQLGEIRLAATFLPPGRVATCVKQLLGHIDAQEDLIADQAKMITTRDGVIAEQRRVMAGQVAQLTERDATIAGRDAIAVKAPALVIDASEAES